MSGSSRGPVVVWCVLCALTIVSVGLSEVEWRGDILSAVIVLTAAVKSRLVIVHYMEVKRAARHWCVLYEAWNFAAAATIIIGLFMSSAP